MNHSPSGLLFSQCIDGFVKYKNAEGLSRRTVESYELDLNRWLEKMGDKPIGKVIPIDVRDYLAYLRTDYVPHTFAKPNASNETSIPRLSPKTLRNHWITFKAFFRWAEVEFKITNPMSDIPGPKYKSAPVPSFSQEEVAAMIKACTYARETKPGNRHSFVSRRPTAKRDEAIMLFLLDNGLRASELCQLKIGEVDMRVGKVNIKHGEEGGAKVGKGRTVFIGKSTRRVVWRYLADREDRNDPEAPIFLNRGSHPFNPNSLRHLIVRLAEKASVQGVHPHKFRHTFGRSLGRLVTAS